MIEKYKYLCFYHLHVDDKTFYIHKIVEAETSSQALDQLKSQRGEHYHLQVKGCLGKLTLDLVEKYLT